MTICGAITANKKRSENEASGHLRKAAKIQPDDVDRLLRQIAGGTTGKRGRKPTPVRANRTGEILRKVFNLAIRWCIRTGKRESPAIRSRSRRTGVRSQARVRPNRAADRGVFEICVISTCIVMSLVRAWRRPTTRRSVLPPPPPPGRSQKAPRPCGRGRLRRSWPAP